MSDTPPFTVERIDDVPLLLAQLERMTVPALLDAHFPTHGNWQGLSLGWVTSVWLAHILSQADHRLNHVQPWVEGRLQMLCLATAQPLTPLDFTDDRLALVLRLLADDTRWVAFEEALFGHLLRVYDLPVKTIRLDTTTASTYREATPGSLFQLGHSKDHRPDLPQVKVSLATLDPLGLPVATAVVAGHRADDPLYAPAITQVRENTARRGLWYIGDCKMAALETRALVHSGGDYYLCPLSAKQVSAEERERLLAPVWAGTQPLTLVPRDGAEGEEEEEPLAAGYETRVTLTATVAGVAITWQERRLVIRSLAQAKAQEAALRQRLIDAQAALAALNERGRGKRRPRDLAGMQEAVSAILGQYRVEGLVAVECTEAVHEQRRRRYGERPARVTVERTIRVSAQLEEAAVEAAVARLGWRVYATNGPEAILGLGEAVAAYRGQYTIERGFGRLKGRPLSLTPMYLTREEHVTGLIRLLSIALRVLCLIEFVVRRGLRAAGEKLSGLYAGQPKRATEQPTSEGLLSAFQEINLVLIRGANDVQRHVTPLTALQERILTLLELPSDTYTKLGAVSLIPRPG
jgi:transposase